MSPEQEKVIERLKKLFALGQSSNEHEAKLAMQKANEIMQEYQISATDVDLAEDSAVVREEVTLDGGKRSTWIQSLAMACANLYDAKCFYANHYHAKGLILRYYGTPADILAARMTFDHLYKSWQSIVDFDLRSHDPENTRTFKRSHGIGFANSIQRRVNELVEQRKVAVKSTTGRDIVVVKNAALDEFMADRKVKTKTLASVEGTAYRSGMTRGNEIPLHGAINEEKTLMIGAK